MEKLRSFVGNTLGTGAVAVGLWVATVDHVAAATACLSAGVLILLIANINHFEFIKGFGFEARTKKLDEKIEEADRLFTQLKLASQLFADISVQVMSRTGRWAGPIPKSETQDLVTRIETLLKSFGVDQIGINKSLDPFHRIMLRGLAIPCIHAFFSELDRHAQLVNIAMGKRSADEQARTGLPIVADDPQYKALQNDWQVMQQFIKEMRQTLDNSDPFALGPLLEQSVADAPGWTDYERSAFLASIKKNIDEWKFYVKNLRLNDVPAWLAREWGH
ncbi:MULTISPECIES: hypothetical protein [unclassified Pseudomonas]|uniref:hypothetical protein n=1 Tax=unclassified Pseudomonas TaxID=196821 RepID=UPI000C2FF233|nr:MULTISPECIES: hypothetical protein [unclassified Pseudomonas]MCU1739574.1 hypothetical protein [Pseudomonas sp. 20S_6.2_Bac1]